MEELATELPIEKIDVDINAEMTVKYGIMTVPTVILIKDEEEVTRTVGPKPKSYYIDQYNEN